MEIDLTTVAGIAAAAWALTSVALYFLRNQGITADGQKLLALGLALVIGLVVYYTGIGLQEYNPAELLIQIILGAIGAGVAHDKLAKPVGGVVSLRGPP